MSSPDVLLNLPISIKLFFKLELRILCPFKSKSVSITIFLPSNAKGASKTSEGTSSWEPAIP